MTHITAGFNCCACGGGVETFKVDLTSDWKDDTGNGCKVYER